MSFPIRRSRPLQQHPQLHLAVIQSLAKEFRVPDG
jgi:hypothetical protein